MAIQEPSESLISFITGDFDEEINDNDYNAIGRKFDLSTSNKILLEKSKVKQNFISSGILQNMNCLKTDRSYEIIETLMSQGNEDTNEIELPLFLPKQKVLNFNSKKTSYTGTNTKNSNAVSFISQANSGTNKDSIVEFDANFLSEVNISKITRDSVNKLNTSKETYKFNIVQNSKGRYLIKRKENFTPISSYLSISSRKNTMKPPLFKNAVPFFRKSPTSRYLTLYHNSSTSSSKPPQSCLSNTSSSLHQNTHNPTRSKPGSVLNMTARSIKNRCKLNRKLLNVT